MPEPTSEIHDMIIDREGIIWLPQHGAAIQGGTQHLFGFNTKTEKFEYSIDMDPTNYLRYPIKWMQSVAVDSQGNVIAAWFMGGALSIWHRKENKVTVHPLPQPNALIYGVNIDKDDNIIATETSGGKLSVLHAKTATENGIGAWTEYTPLRYPGQIHRSNADFQGNIVYGEWAAGKIPGAIGIINEATSEQTVFNIPEQNAQPYDVEADPDGYHIWFADSPAPDRNAMIGRLNIKDGTFTFYPKPQYDADTPKIQITRDGAVWYAPRGSVRAPGMGVLYTDKDKITGLGAYYLYGPPGYPFKVPADTAKAR
jgi:hypothetical protein